MLSISSGSGIERKPASFCTWARFVFTVVFPWEISMSFAVSDALATISSFPHLPSRHSSDRDANHETAAAHSSHTQKRRGGLGGLGGLPMFPGFFRVEVGGLAWQSW